MGAFIFFSWRSQGPGVTYDIAGGLVSDLVQNGGTSGASCLANDLIDPLWSDVREDRDPGETYYYMVRASNYCGSGTYGSGSDDTERQPGTDCP